MWHVAVKCMLFNTVSKKKWKSQFFRNIAPCWLVKISPIKDLVCGLLHLEYGPMFLRNVGSIYAYLQRNMPQGFTVWQGT